MSDASEQRLTIWKVGCPHYGGIPPDDLPDDVRTRAEAAGLLCEVRSFPAEGFHLIFAEAVRESRSPDLLVVGNYGILEGIVTDRGAFTGVSDFLRKGDLIYVSCVFNSLLGPQGGWVHLVKPSPNHARAAELASARPPVPASWPADVFPGDTGDVRRVAHAAAEAWLNVRADLLWPMLDPEHLVMRGEGGEPGNDTIDMEVARVWGNHCLAFCGLVARWPARNNALGGGFLVAALRRSDDGPWRVLFVSADPITVEHLNEAVPKLAGDLVGEAPPVLPVRITYPEDGEYPDIQPDDVNGPGDDARFGFFKWSREHDKTPLAEVVEFATCGDEIGDSRILALRDGLDTRAGQLSAGWLWSTGRRWQWRVWSVGADGRLAFSSSREFYC